MKFHGGEKLSWSRLERVLSGHASASDIADLGAGSTPRTAARDTGRPANHATQPAFAELHAISSYSFLQGASSPQELVDRAAELGLSGLALLDRDGFYGIVQLAEAAVGSGLLTVFGAELTLPGQRVLPLLCRNVEGYRALSHVISRAYLDGGQKAHPEYPPLAALAERLGDSCVVLVGPEWLADLEQLRAAFGDENVVLEYPATMVPEDDDHRLALDGAPAHLRRIVSARPRAAHRAHASIAGAKQALARREAYPQVYGDLHPMGSSWLRSAEQLLRMGVNPALIQEADALARECAFTLDLVAPRLPLRDTPAGYTEMTWLEKLTWERGEKRYASRPPEVWRKAKKQIAYELGVIEELGFPGYFLIVCEIVDFCKANNILCQGRGSAANSVVCFALGITNAEPITAKLLFERFLSAERDGPPDIDLDIESTRREIVIQHVYATYGRDNAAQVANVITYRRRGALRDAGRALGYPQGAIDSWRNPNNPPPSDVAQLAENLYGQPRHLGIHSGGMVICDRPIADVVPVQWARREKRSVVQWDKDDCAAIGLVKFDLLGLGMLEALHHMIDLVEQTTGTTVNLWELDLTDPEVYAMLATGDAVGVFQVESRAQLATLPRLKPTCFFDLVVEIALIRPGPIQGGSVHPYLRRRDGREAITYEHPVLEKALGKTLGIPLFQEQLMQIAVDAAGFSGAEADLLRRAMGSKRSPQKMEALRHKFFTGCWQTNRIPADTAAVLWAKIVAFAAYGFPESHSQSFASLVFFSAWFKRYYPAHFCAGLLRAQPMGFYSPQSLIHDARRHGVRILPLDIAHSDVEATVPEPNTLRLGLSMCKGLSETAASRIVAARNAEGALSSIAELARRADLTVAQVEALARAGALDELGGGRRQALWNAGVAATEKNTMLPGLTVTTSPTLPGMSALELLATDIATTGVSTQAHPLELFREALAARGVVPARQLGAQLEGKRCFVAGVVTHRQRPRTASGVTFLGLEDETGLINVVVSPGLWKRYEQVVRASKAVLIRGIVQKSGEVAAVLADKVEDIPVGQWISAGSRDFR